MNYLVKSFEQLTATIYRVILEPASEETIIYQAGQYIEILQEGCEPKPFSIANAPLSDNRNIELEIRHYPDNLYTGAVIDEIQKQKQLNLRGAFGRCVLQKVPAYPLLFLAGGAGIAPIKALIEQALAEKIAQPIYLYWGARIIADFYLQDVIFNWQKHNANFHYIPILSGKHELDQWHDKTGWVHETVINDSHDFSKCHVYISGPIGMVYAAFHALKTKNANENFIYSDMF